MGKVLPKPLASNDPSKIGCVSASTASDMGAYFDSALAHVPHKSDMLHNPLLRDAATQATMAPTPRCRDRLMAPTPTAPHANSKTPRPLANYLQQPHRLVHRLHPLLLQLEHHGIQPGLWRLFDHVICPMPSGTSHAPSDPSCELLAWATSLPCRESSAWLCTSS